MGIEYNRIKHGNPTCVCVCVCLTLANCLHCYTELHCVFGDWW